MLEKIRPNLKKLKDVLNNVDKHKALVRAYFVIVGFILFLTLYHVGYAKRIIPGVRIGDVFVGGMNFPEAVSAVRAFEENLDKTVELTYDGKIYNISGSDIGLVYDVESTVARAFELGRSGNIFVDTKDKLASLIKTIKIRSYYSVDDQSLSNEFARIRGEINVEARSASFALNEGDLTIASAETGRRVDDQQMYDLVIAAFEKMDFRQKELAVDEDDPELENVDLERVRDAVTKIIANPMVVHFEDRNWQLSEEDLLDLVQVSVRAFIPTVGLNDARFEAYMDTLSLDIDVLPRGEVTSVENNVVTGFQLTTDGYELDRDKFKNDFKEAFLKGESEVTAEVRKVEQHSDASKYGIFALLGEGTSTYVGSIPGRIANLTLAAERTDGVLVPPGGIYSMNQSVGPISGATGYSTAYVIANGRTVLGDGGGVCQTSTTLFRAVLDAGLPIVERHPHAYRVSYYEQDRPVGFDASIYQPSLDLKFKNDTPNYVLVTSSADVPNSSLTFRIYGTPDGRRVEVSEPVITSQSPPPEPLYQDDPTLPKGTVKQVDWAAWGANVYLTRKVYKANGEIMQDDTFSSRYQPWQAVYLRGTKE